MAYDSTIPKSTDKPSRSQPSILGNFGTINTANTVNHEALGSANQGKHKYISFPAQIGAPPTPPFVSGEPGMYAFANVATSQNEIYISKKNQVTDTLIPMTASSLSITSAPAANTAGWSMLPSGILIKWGYGATTGLQTTVTYDSTVPFGAVFSTVITSTHGGGVNDHLITVYTTGNASFEIESTSSASPTVYKTTGFYYFSIGRPT